ncbi:hypothetical protein M231_05764 [Tremella mesenterica]|nr:hypothetical protein M231_05764 [Tremella mesenterica]
MSKASEPEPHRALVQNGMVNPWDHKDSHDVHPSSTAMFKYRHKTREGHMEDSLPALNEDVRKLKEGLNPKFKAA